MVGVSIGASTVGALEAHSTMAEAVLAKCEECYCGGPHAHPSVTDMVVVPQCSTMCHDEERLAEFCDTVELPTDPDLIRASQPPTRPPHHH